MSQLKLYLFLFLFFFSAIVKAQHLSESELHLAKTQYRTMMDSELYKKHWTLLDEFITKLKNNRMPLEKDWDLWILQNWHKTEFKSANEATIFKDRLFAFFDQLKKENESLYKMILRSNFEQRRIILAPEKDLYEKTILTRVNR